MQPLERKILEELAKAKENRETNINLNAIWRECGSVDPQEFAHAWGALDAGELVHGELFIGGAAIEGLGKITGKGAESLKEP